jgi:hypothetical protein
MVCITLLNDEDSSVRMAAVETLESVIPMRIARSFDGRREAIAALGRVCVDWNARARAVALRVLVAIADKSDFDVQAAVMGEVLKDATELPLFARIAAVEAVPIVTRSGDPYAVRQLIQVPPPNPPRPNRRTAPAPRTPHRPASEPRGPTSAGAGRRGPGRAPHDRGCAAQAREARRRTGTRSPRRETPAV